MTRWGIVFLLLAAFVMLPITASAAECKGVEFPETATLDGHKLVLHGMGLRSAALGIKVFVAALYVPEKTTNAKTLMDLKKPKKLVLTFMRDVSTKQVVKAYRQNLDAAPDSIREDITEDYERIIAHAKGVKKGQQNIFAYTPEDGLKLYTAGKHLVTITNPVTIEYFLGFYMGPRPRFQSMRDAIVNDGCR